MARYDWGWSRGYDRDLGTRGGYGAEYSGWGEAWGGGPLAGGRGWGGGAYGGYGSRYGTGGAPGGRGYDRDLGGYGGRGRFQGGTGDGGWAGGYGGGYGGYAGSSSYDRGLYGGGYPAYGGYPGGREQGMYYGGRSGYDRSYQSGGPGYGAGWSRSGGVGRGYDRGYAGEPFMPEEAYRRHPEYDRPQHHAHDPWADAGRRAGMDMDDDEIRQVVRQSLYGDSWVDADSIQVEVNGGVVTLTGEVSDYMEARYAWDDAWESAGVRGVVNQLTVRTDQPQAHHGEVLPQSGGDQQRGSAGE